MRGAPAKPLVPNGFRTEGETGHAGYVSHPTPRGEALPGPREVLTTGVEGWCGPRKTLPRQRSSCAHFLFRQLPPSSSLDERSELTVP